MRYDRTVIAYHGCDAEIARQLLDGAPFKKSRNDYDWLGTGVYFWEYGADRALRFARDQRKRAKVDDPAVVGALIQLGNCFDLMDTHFTDMLSKAYEPYAAAMAEMGVTPPENRGGTPDKLLRFKDCAVLNFWLDFVQSDLGLAYDTVRGVFTEGGPVFEGSGIRGQSHIQIAVRNTDCILGVFRPQ